MALIIYIYVVTRSTNMLQVCRFRALTEACNESEKMLIDTALNLGGRQDKEEIM